LGGVDCFEFSEEEALDLTLKNNEGIIEIVLKDKYEESEYKETSHMMENSSISLCDPQGEEFIIDNENEDVKGDWVLAIILKDIIKKKNLSFNCRVSTYVK